MDSTPRICFVGDTRGVRERTEQVVARAGDLGCHTIIQVGDFGIWPEMRHSRPCTDGFEVEVAAMCERAGVDLLLFVDGNHDWHPWLAVQLPKYEARTQTKDPASVPVEETGRVRWVPRGTVLGVAGLRILFCGGAPSFDPELRVPRLSWWPEEEIASAEVARACASGAATGGVDVLVTHDVSELLGCGGNPIEDQMDVVDVATLAGTPTISQVA